jgi:hypothetical protein
MRNALCGMLAIGLLLSAGCTKKRQQERSEPTLVPLSIARETPAAPALAEEEPEPTPVDAPLPSRSEASVPLWDSAVCGVALGAVQRRLHDRGHAPGAPDGVWGTDTEAAIREFQRERELPVTGLPGALTLSALFAADDARSVQRVRGTEPIVPAAPRASDAVPFAGGLGAGLLLAVVLLSSRR